MAKKQHNDQRTVPTSMDWTSEDFLASDAFKAAPLGGFNEHSPDSSAVLNCPIGPDGFHMQPVWSWPERIVMLRDQGIHPVTVEDFKRNGMVCASPSVYQSPDGLVYRDGNSLVLCWTTKTNYDRIQRNRAEAAERCKGSRNPAFQGYLESANAIGDRHGISHFTEDRFQGVEQMSREAEGEGFIPVPGKKTSVSLAGPKQ